jgi:hypothetical protein
MRNRVLTDQNNVFSQQWQEAIELAKSKLVIAQARQKKYYDRSVKECSFKKNDHVLMKIMSVQTGKFYMRWDGPFIIVKKLSDMNYVIHHVTDDYQIVVHVNRLRKWNGDPKSIKDKSASMENVNPTISSDANVETTAPASTAKNNNSENESISENVNQNKRKNVIENENEIIVDIHAPNPLPTSEEENTIPQTVETIATETETTTSQSNTNSTTNAEDTTSRQPQTSTAPTKRRVGRPRKNQGPPKPDILPSTHKFTLRSTTRLPK